MVYSTANPISLWHKKPASKVYTRVTATTYITTSVETDQQIYATTLCYSHIPANVDLPTTAALQDAKIQPQALLKPLGQNGRYAIECRKHF